MQHLGTLGVGGLLGDLGVAGLGVSVGSWFLGRARTRSRTRAIVVALFAGMVLAGTVGASRGAPSLTDSSPRYWVTSNGTMQRIASVDPEVARNVFDSPIAVSLGGWGTAVEGESWASYAQFASDLETGRIPSNVRAVMYDPEAWDVTPVTEQRDPITYIRRFEDLAHKHGYFAIVTPHPGLVTVPGARCGERPGESEADAYVRCRIAGRAARHADAVETQAQALERYPSIYRAFVAATASQARAANPNVIMLSGLSTGPGYSATPQMLYSAYQSVQGIVDGHYISLSGGQAPQVAAAFLRMVAGTRR